MHRQVSDIASNINTRSGQATAQQSLLISLDETSLAPTPEHQLLLGFHFGDEPCPAMNEGMVSLQLQPLDRETLFESWWYKGEVKHSRSGLARVAECDDYTVVIVEMDPVDAAGMKAQAREAYRELILATRATKHSRMVKIWNYFGDINSGEADAEKYRQFSIGRAEIFDELGVTDEDAPTGTAVGTRDGSGMTLISIASNHAFCPAENPRQVSAFHYPRIYGPSSPKFSRGGFVTLDSHKLFLISGTAAVVGHASNFPYDTALQTDETFKNLSYLCNTITSLDNGNQPFELDAQSVLRVYLRDPADYPAAVKKIQQHFGTSHRHVAYLHGIICRRELMVEIDGVKVTGPDNPARITEPDN